MSLVRLSFEGLSAKWQQKIADLQPRTAEVLQSLISKKIAGAEWTGWFNYPKNKGYKELQDIQHFAQKNQIEYDCVVLVGVGGSYLGTAAIYEALSSKFRKDPNIKKLLVYGHHLCDDYTREFLTELDDFNPLVVVISKSGTTLEPSVAFSLLESHMEKLYGAEAAQRIVVVTDESSGELRQHAKKKSYQSFVVPRDVGGRFSVLTPVGLVPLVLLGFDVEKILRSAQLIFDEVQAVKAEHPALEYAAARFVAHENELSAEAFLYNFSKLGDFVEWLKQLLGESEGKGGKGLFPVGVRLTTDLHSLGQYLQDGKPLFLATFLEAANPQQGSGMPLPKGTSPRRLTVHDVNQQALEATFQAYVERGTPCIRLQVGQFDAEHLGALIAFFEVSCAVSAGLLGVNAYDQPGVEVYKKHLKELMQGP